MNFLKVSEVGLTYQSKVKTSEAPVIRGSATAEAILRQNWSDDIELCETFNILLLNRANRVKGITTISKGGVTGTVVDAKLVFATALKTMSCAIILAHNHPSGNLKASQADCDITRKLKEAARLLDIDVLDHLILTSEGYMSFADDGLIF